ncbi:solute carrier family 2, facilitated glucose transporter member 1-like isoform X2 [Schistocerca serialis cubense]|uniref:solute carrier family 2, facilitated glucose transporter member 1-like isoform X2 n=1 Tax=Schistocerca serialis cubense TaxID=2023355 RepID=UPI00214E74A9|nr:solute carrier family 2, facilitated glucose transporter member 1-like isoform X2 [Schistocerca serialis cubense]
MPSTAFYSSNMSLDRAKDLVKGSLKALNIGGSVDHKDVESRQPILVAEDNSSKGQQQGWTPLLVFVGIITAVGSCIPVGYNIGVMNTPAHIIKQFCNESVMETYGIQMSTSEMNTLWSVIVSVFLVGGMTGSLTGGWVADRWGRKAAVVINNGQGLVAAVLFVCSRYAKSVEMLIAARLIVGLSSGLTTTTVPMYLTEIAPVAIRGAMGVLCPIGLNVGVLLGQIMGLKDVLGVEETWHFLLGLYAIPVLLSVCGICFLPESPKYLCVIRGEEQRAKMELCRLRGTSPEAVEGEMQELRQGRAAVQGTAEVKEWGAGKVLTSPSLMLPLLLVCSMQFGQQCSGINAVFYYSVTIFKSAGLSTDASQFATIGAGGVNLLVTILAIPLLNRFGRRYLVLLSCWTATLCLVVLCVSITYITSTSWMPYFCIFAVLSYVFCYGLGLGPIPYFIGSELFETGPRPIAMAFGSMSNWAGNFIIGMTFPWLQSVIGQFSFLLFAVTTALLSAFLKFYFPETKGTRISDIADMLKYGFRSKIYSAPAFSGSVGNLETAVAKSELYSNVGQLHNAGNEPLVLVLPQNDDVKIPIAPSHHSLPLTPSHHTLPRVMPSIPEKLSDMAHEGLQMPDTEEHNDQL